MEVKKKSDEKFSAPKSTLSSAATSPANHASQSQSSNLGFSISHTDHDQNQNQLVPHCSPEAHEGIINSTINFSELHQVFLSGNSLQHETTPQKSQGSLQVQYYSSPETTAYSILPIQSVEQRDSTVNGEISGEIKSSMITVKEKNREPSTKRKHPGETSLNVVNGEINNGGNGKDTGQPLGHEQIFWERTSKYRGVSRGNIERYETFLWDNSDPQAKPKTVYVGGFANEETAARAYDLAALKLWGVSAQINFPLSEYEKDLEEMKNMTKKEYLLTLRRKSKGFSKGVSIYRGVSRNPAYNKWQARLGKSKDTKGIYLGTFDSEEEAAKAYDVAAIRVKGLEAITNFNIREYDVKSILQSLKLPIGKGASKFLKENSVNDVLVKKRKTGKLPILHLQVNSDGVEHNPNSVTGHVHKNPNPSADAHLLEHSQDLAARENQKYNKHVLHEFPSHSLIKAYETPSSSLLQAHQNGFQTISTEDGCALQIDKDLSGQIMEGVSSDGIFEDFMGEKDTDQDLVFDFLQENFLPQLSPHNEQFLFYLNDSNKHQNPHQNLDFQSNPSLRGGLSTDTISGIDLWENPKCTYGEEFLSSKILKGESERNSNGSSK